MPITRTFTDIDLNFTRHPVTGDVAMRYDASAVKASVKNLVMTAFYERLFHSEIGTNIPGLLFDLAGPSLTVRLQKSIEDVINNYEPRVTLNSVDVQYQPDNYSVAVTIFFTIINTVAPLSVDLILERTR